MPGSAGKGGALTHRNLNLSDHIAIWDGELYDLRDPQTVMLS